MVHDDYNELGELREVAKKFHMLRKKLKKSLPNHMGAEQFLAMTSLKMTQAEVEYWVLHMQACPCCKATYDASLGDDIEPEETLASVSLIDDFNKEELKAIMASL